MTGTRTASVRTRSVIAEILGVQVVDEACCRRPAWPRPGRDGRERRRRHPRCRQMAAARSVHASRPSTEKVTVFTVRHRIRRLDDDFEPGRPADNRVARWRRDPHASAPCAGARAPASARALASVLNHTAFIAKLRPGSIRRIRRCSCVLAPRRLSDRHERPIGCEQPEILFHASLRSAWTNSIEAAAIVGSRLDRRCSRNRALPTMSTGAEERGAACVNRSRISVSRKFRSGNALAIMPAFRRPAKLSHGRRSGSAGTGIPGVGFAGAPHASRRVDRRRGRVRAREARSATGIRPRARDRARRSRAAASAAARRVQRVRRWRCASPAVARARARSASALHRAGDRVASASVSVAGETSATASMKARRSESADRRASRRWLDRQPHQMKSARAASRPSREPVTLRPLRRRPCPAAAASTGCDCAAGRNPKS